MTPDPAWCPTHQSYSWCEHNGGVMGKTGWERPTTDPAAVAALARSLVEIEEDRLCGDCPPRRPRRRA